MDKWHCVELKERGASQSHLNDICRLREIGDSIAEEAAQMNTNHKGPSVHGHLAEATTSAKLIAVPT